MCGIAGWISLGTSNHNFRDVRAAVTAIETIVGMQRHRGPNSDGIWIDKNNRAVLGHNRLAILELSEAGAQPMTDTDQDWTITYNGELFNYQSLRKVLEQKHGIKFRGESDTEVFLYGVKVWGIDEFLRLADGMFAAGLFSSKTGELILVRDRAGEKPLYYKKTPTSLSFASELRPLARGIDSLPNLDLDAVKLYLTLRYVPAPLTIYEGYKKLKPGHILTINRDGELSERAYFSWDPHASELPENPKTFDRVVQLTEQILVDSLQKRLMSNVPVGFFLSGGIDSSIASALVRRHFGFNINTYTIGFEGDDDSEHFISERTAAFIGSRHTARTFRINELSEISNTLIQSMDEPNGDRSCVPTYLLCKHAREEVTVAIGGDGGDELFGGYSRYENLDYQMGEDRFPRALDALLWYYTYRLPVFIPSTVKEIITSATPFYLETLEDFATHLYSPSRPEIDIRYVDFKSYLPGAVLSKIDRMSMLNSLEVRSPFFCANVFDLSSRLPRRFLREGSRTKPVLRELCSRLGLEHVAHLKKKGFGMPADFLSRDQDRLRIRLNTAADRIGETLGPRINVDNLKNYAFQNMNSLWATIVLGEWMETGRAP